MRQLLLRLPAGACLAGAGYLHADLYVHGYQTIPVIGPAFLVQASGSFAVAVLLVVSESPVLRVLAAGLVAGALGGFVLSRTVGLYGFVEHGLQPAPQALLSLVFEIAVLLLLAMPLARRIGGR
ncbi:MAG TPA: hypothetical protein VEO01_10205 [Pseudonocardiaceae bacterium]|nr:hypothetical protein [Pseudonocardiaceae bacterium]